MSEKQADDIVEAGSSTEALAKINEETANLIAWSLSSSSITFQEFEEQLMPKMFVLGRLFVLLFLCMREEHYKETHPDAVLLQEPVGIFDGFDGFILVQKSKLGIEKEQTTDIAGGRIDELAWVFVLQSLNRYMD